MRPPLPDRVAPRWLLITVAWAVPVLFPVLATIVNSVSPVWLAWMPPFARIQILAFGVVIGGLALGAARLRLRDLGLAIHDLPMAAAVTLAVWLAAQGILAGGSLLRAHPVVGHAAWVGGSVAAGLVPFLGNLLGTALFEETTYRGLVLAHLHARLRARLGGTTAVMIAVAGSAGLFSLAHVPALMFQPRSLAEYGAIIAWTFLGGLYGALLYIRTRNLALVMGLHALTNSPLALVQAPDGVATLVVLALGLALAMVWPATFGRRER